MKSLLALPTPRTLLPGLMLLAALSGCGQTGPLYMPNHPVGHGAHRAPAPVAATTTATTPVTQIAPPSPSAGITPPVAGSNANNTQTQTQQTQTQTQQTQTDDQQPAATEQ